MTSDHASTTAVPGARLQAALRAHAARGSAPALIPYLTAGFPSRERFIPQLVQLSRHASAIEVGVPFTDPMADGVTIQRSSRAALAAGVTLDWILDELRASRASIPVPIVLMGYLNPFLAGGLPRLAQSCAAAGVDALIIPDLPIEECRPVRDALHAVGVGLVQLVSPVTPSERAAEIARLTDGFLYVVSVTGVTGGAAAPTPANAPLHALLARLRPLTDKPLCAGFGIRSRAQVDDLRGKADGVIVGSAVVEAAERGDDLATFLGSLVGS